MWLLGRSSHCKWLYLGTGVPNQPLFNGRSHEKRGTKSWKPGNQNTFDSWDPLFHHGFSQLGTGVSGWRSSKKKHDWTPVFYSISTIFLDYYRVFSGLYCDSLFITDGIISWDYWSSTIILIYQGSPWCFTNTNIITDLSILHSPDSPGPNKSFRIRRPVDQALGQSFDEKEEQWPAVPAVVPGAEDGNDTDCDTFLAAEFSCLANIS